MRISSRVMWLLLLPTGLLILLAIIIPLGIMAYDSMFHFQFLSPTGSPGLSNYRAIFVDPATRGLYAQLTITTLAIAVPVTVACVVAGYLVAYAMVFGNPRYRRVLFALVLSALMASYLARVYAWRTLLGDRGFVNSSLLSLGVVDQPIQLLLYSRLSVILAEVNLLTPFAALTFFAALSGISPDLREAARELGASRMQTFRLVVLPLTGPAVLATSLVVFLLAAGDYVTPQLVGGTNSQTIGVALAANFGQTPDYGLGGAMGLVLLAGFLFAYVGMRRLLTWSKMLPKVTVL